MFLALLRRQSISVYLKNTVAPLVVNLPTNLVSNLEVKNPKGLSEFLASFLKAGGISGDEGVLVLTNEVYFARDLGPMNREDTQEAVREFLGLVPIGISDMVSKETETEGKKWVVVSNRSLGVAIVYGFAEADLKITSVLPEFLLGINSDSVLSLEIVAGALARAKEKKSYSMLQNIFAFEKKPLWKFW